MCACVYGALGESKLDKAIFQIVPYWTLHNAQVSLCTTSLPSLHFTFQERGFTLVTEAHMKERIQVQTRAPQFADQVREHQTHWKLTYYQLRGWGRQNKCLELLGALYRSRDSSGASPLL